MMKIPGNSDGSAREPVPVGFVPMPTSDYRAHRKILEATVQPGRPKHVEVAPAPITPIKGPRVLMWKQDPKVTEIGIRKAYIPSPVLSGPRDERIQIAGLPIVNKNMLGDLIESPGTPAFDAVHTFAVVRQTLTMYQRTLGGVSVPWQWNSADAANTDPIRVFPHAGETANAFYSRDQKALKFFFFTPPGEAEVFTCRSFDIVAHETGHAVLDSLKPGWLMFGNFPQTGALHESFGDLTAIFLCLSQMDQAEAVIAQTKADLHDKTFLVDLAEQFGLALGRPNGLRNADNDLTLSQVGSEVHALSQVFTGGIYDVLADIFLFERNSAKKDDARLLYEVGQYLCSLVVRGFIQAPDQNASFAQVVNKMLAITVTDGKPVQYRNFLRNRFAVREVIVSPTPLTEDLREEIELKADIVDQPGAQQDRRACCGTMQLDEYLGIEQALQSQREDLTRSVHEHTILNTARSAYSA